MSPGARERGALAIVLHTHMPYVEGFGTWPFGEEWLWEAIVGSYLPLLELLDTGVPVTLSVTPVLCDQLEAPGLAPRFRRFVEEVRGGTHERDAAGLREGGHEQLAGELERAWREDYLAALERLDARSEDLLAALGPHARWTSSATHAILPLLATEAGVRAQLGSGIASHRRRFGGWGGGLWLPECAYAPWLEGGLLEAGVRTVCVELTSAFGEGSWEHLQPLAGERGLVLVPIDRSTISLVWSDRGYPAGGPYRDYHRLTTFHHNPWNNAGDAYDHDAALQRARADAADFVTHVRARLRDGAEAAPGPLPGGGLVVCALDTELLGHWWYEGVSWLGPWSRRPPARASSSCASTRPWRRASRGQCQWRPPRSGGPSAGAPAGISRRGPRRGWRSSPSGPAPPSSRCSRPDPRYRPRRCASCSPCRPATGPS